MTGKRHFQLTEQEEQELKAAFQENADGPMRTRLQAVRPYGSGYVVEDIDVRRSDRLPPAAGAGHLS